MDNGSSIKNPINLELIKLKIMLVKSITKLLLEMSNKIFELKVKQWDSKRSWNKEQEYMYIQEYISSWNQIKDLWEYYMKLPDKNL